MLINKRIFGLDISDNSIEVMQLDKFFGRTRVVAYGRTILNGELVKDGIIKKPDLLAQTIKEVMQSAKPKAIDSSECILSLPESKVYTHLFTFPANINKEQIKTSLPYEAEKVIPFTTKEIYFDFKIISQDDKWQKILYAACEYQIIESYNQVLKKIGVQPIAFDLESVSMGRSLIQGKDIKQPVMLMDIGARSTNVTVFINGAIHVSRIINIAGNHFTKAVARNLNILEKDAEEQKKKIGFDPSHANAKLVFILQKEFIRIVKEVKEVSEYFANKTQNKISKIILTGGSALLPKLDEYLSENLSLPVEIGQPITKSHLENKKIFDRQEVLYANVTGLALRGVMSRPKNADLNLNSIQVKKLEIVPAPTDKREWKKIYISAGIFGILVVFFLVLLFWTRNDIVDTRPLELKLPSGVDEAALDQLLEEQAITEAEIVVIQIEVKEGIGQLNVRSGPGYDYGVVSQIKAGEQYTLLAEEGQWYKIQLNEQTDGWVIADFAEKSQ